MKIIKVDNYDRDNVPDLLIADNVTFYYAKCIVEFLNSNFNGDHSPDYFKIVEDAYILKERNLS